jgi:multidrug efflux pump subunit AcrA (membrane-fusion protein)
VIGFSSCTKKPTPQAPLQPVTFAVATAESVPLTIDTFGNVVTIADVTLQAQVEGILLRYAVDEGLSRAT